MLLFSRNSADTRRRGTRHSARGAALETATRVNFQEDPQGSRGHLSTQGDTLSKPSWRRSEICHSKGEYREGSLVMGLYLSCGSFSTPHFWERAIELGWRWFATTREPLLIGYPLVLGIGCHSWDGAAQSSAVWLRYTGLSTFWPPKWSEMTVAGSHNTAQAKTPPKLGLACEGVVCSVGCNRLS